MQEAWNRRSGMPVAFHTDKSLRALFTSAAGNAEWVVYGGVLCTDEMVDRVLDLKHGQALVVDGRVLAYRGENVTGTELTDLTIIENSEKIEVGHSVILMDRPWHLFQHCAQAIAVDMQLVRLEHVSSDLSGTNTVIGDPSLIHLEEGAIVEASILNTTSGPIYIGKDAVVMEGCAIRGPFSLGSSAQLKMGAKIYGASSFGPECRVGGEVNNSIMLGYSNKGHDGFLGNSVLGEWCNLGADTNNSNLKNNYGEVRVYSYANRSMEGTGLQFCGLMMGDHSKAGINTMFNTGTVVGVCANVFGGGFPPKHIPSFSWGGAEGFEEYDMEKALTTAHNVMKRREVELSNEHIQLLQHVKDRYGLGRL